MDHKPENVSDKTISKLESLDEEINLVKERKSKKDRRGRKSTWKESAIDNLVDCICFKEYVRKKLIFTNKKASKNGEIYQKVISENGKKREERGRLYKYSLKKTRFKFKALGSICKRIVLLRKTSGIINFVEEKGFGKCFFLVCFHKY